MPRHLGIRSQLLGLVAAAAVPFLVLIGVALWNPIPHSADRGARPRLQRGARHRRADRRPSRQSRKPQPRAEPRRRPRARRHGGERRAAVRTEGASCPASYPTSPWSAPDGENIGSASGARYNIGDRDYFQQALAGTADRGRRSRAQSARVTNGCFRSRGRSGTRAGEIQAVLLIGTLIAKFQDAIRVDHLPAGSIVRIVNDKGIVVASFPDVPGVVGRDLSNLDAVVRHLQAKETSEVSTWSDKVPRFTGYSTAHRAPWLVSVGFPTEVASAGITTRLEAQPTVRHLRRSPSPRSSPGCCRAASFVRCASSSATPRSSPSGELSHRTSIAAAQRIRPAR